jgi:hypothetical protein
MSAEAKGVAANRLTELVTRTVLGHRVVDVLRDGQPALVLCLRCQAVWLEGADGLTVCGEGDDRKEFFNQISAELDRAYAKHGRGQWGRHEFYGIIAEEFDEMWADIKSDAPQDVLEKEIVQVAAMCMRYLETRDRYREPDQFWSHD